MDNKSTVNKLTDSLIKKYSRGDGKIFFIVFFVLILLLFTGIISEYYVDKLKNNWQSILTEEINQIKYSATEEFNIKERLLSRALNKLKQNLKTELHKSEETYKLFIREINQADYEDFSIEIYAPNGKLIGWNRSSNIHFNELFPLPAQIGETFFLEKELVYCLSIIDTFHFQLDDFYILLSLPIEKKYKLHNKYFKESSIVNSISEKIQTETQIDFNPYTTASLDGRKYSFEILNNKNKKIGLVTIDKPTIKNRIYTITNLTSSVQSIFILLGLTIIGIGLRRDYKSLSSYLAKFSFLIIYLLLFRVLLFIFSIPSRFINGEITDPANFSSTFGFGVVKSPLEFLVTNIFVSIAALQFFRYSLKYFRDGRQFKLRISTYFSIAIVITLFPLLLRAFAAAMQSVVYDSNLRYFNDFDILPELAVLVMHTNVLLLGISFIFVLVALSVFLIKLMFSNTDRFNKNHFLITSFIIIIATIAFYLISNNPLYSIFNLIVLVITILWIFFIIIRNKSDLIKYHIVILFIASLNSVILLNYFDTLRERNSVKNIALEINRLNEQLIKYYLTENIKQFYPNQYEQNLLLRKDINFNSLAFIKWSKSNLHKEELNSFISIYDRLGKVVGGFKIGFDFRDNIRSLLGKFNDIIFIDESNSDSLSKRITAYSKYIEQGAPQLVLSSGIDFEVTRLGGLDFPEFLQSDLNIINQFINLEKVKIFQFKNKQMVQFYGEVYPNKEQIKHIFQVKLDSIYNDGWTKIKFDDEKYETYVLRSNADGDEITTVISVAENKFSWSLFNFFKVFIIHSIFIFIIILIVTISRIKRIIITFRTKLLLLFLFISIIPITFLGLYNRNLLDERSTLGVQNELKQKLLLVESNLNSYSGQNIKISDAANKVFKSLNISFNLFEETNLIYSSNSQFYEIDLINDKINSQVYYSLKYDKFREYFAKESIENYLFLSFYKVIRLDKKEYILNVNQAFNKSNNIISTSEFDIVFFGIYSLTLVIIIFSSTLMANQISSPIQRLTKAAEALGKGDLNVKIEHNEKGELKELLDGFNKMTDELKRNQIELAEYERESAWKEMAKQVAHEIKNPLTPMKLTLQQLIVTFRERREDFDKLFDKVSSTILTQIDNLNQIASEFSRFAKMPNINFEKFDLWVLISELADIYLNEKVKINLPTVTEQIIIENDKNQLSRIFINLIRNSIQASATVINVSIKKTDNILEIEFEDNGKGISLELQDKIFNENFSTKKQGMGLGLKIAKKYLNSVNGDIKLESSSEKGTIFKIILPYEKK